MMHRNTHFTQLVLRIDKADLVAVSQLIKTQFPQIVLSIGYASITLWVKDEDVSAIQKIVEKYFKIRLETVLAHEVKWVVGLHSFGVARGL
jgi:hypothetical protein